MNLLADVDGVQSASAMHADHGEKSWSGNCSLEMIALDVQAVPLPHGAYVCSPGAT